MALTIRENNSATIKCLVKTSTGGPQNVSGWSFQFRVQATDGTTLFDKLSSISGQILIIDTANGEVHVNIDPIDTSGKTGTFKYEFKGTDTSTNSYTLDGPSDFNIRSTII